MPHPAEDETLRSPAVALALVVALGALAACSGDGASDAGAPGDSGVIEDAADAPDAAHLDARPLAPDAELVVFHDGGGPMACTESCDCPQGLGCIGGECRSTGAPIWCCTKPDCPMGQACLGAMDRPSTCPASDAGVVVPETCDPPDASVRVGYDGGVGSVGAACESDFECSQAEGLTCWDRSEPPYVWGYCTNDGCVGGCPAGSMCVQFNVPPPDGPISGCLQVCNFDTDCRSDAYCQFLQAGGFGVCLPSCRDDIFDCAPRDGTSWCNPVSGRCEPNTCHGPSTVGGPCETNRDCAEELVCMTEFAWGFAGGMCTRVCSGLLESTPCEAGETCQDFAGVGLCFRDCVNGTCPDRANAQCFALDATWADPSCIAL
ncbi:hypothetical protein L6R52_12745 [Myxococcota bacterium]|nr:hypothetical protein [Myxococcota bacterium]